MCATPMCRETRPLVSVLMGTRYISDDISLLRNSVTSILCQTLTEYEFVICDDGSSENAKKYLEYVSETDARIRLVRNEKCLNLASKLNLCLRYSKGYFLARMDDDDWSYPNRLEKEVQFLRNHQNIAYVGCDVALVQDGEKIGERYLPKYPMVEDFYFTQPYIHPALMFRRAILEAVGGYDESTDCLLCEDYDLLLRLYKAGYVGANLQEILLDYTIPSSPKGSRRMRHRMNEMKTRYKRFKELGKLPMALPYIFKPVIVGLIPDSLLEKLKEKRRRKG